MRDTARKVGNSKALGSKKLNAVTRGAVAPDSDNANGDLPITQNTARSNEDIRGCARRCFSALPSRAGRLVRPARSLVSRSFLASPAPWENPRSPCQARKICRDARLGNNPSLRREISRRYRGGTLSGGLTSTH